MAFFKKKSNATHADQELSLSEKIDDKNIERGLPNLDNPQGKSNMGKVGLFLGLLFATGLIAAGAIVLASSDNAAPAANEQTELDVVQSNQSHNFNQDKSDIRALEDLEMADASAPIEEPQQVPPIESTASSEPQEPPINPRLLGDVLVNFGSNGMTTTATNSSGDHQQENGTFMASTEPLSLTSLGGNEAKETNFANSLTPTLTTTAHAQQIANRDFLLAKGTNILCTLDTQIITTRPGFTRCVITRDIYSANGKVLLLEKGSRIIGEQTSALLQGQARVGILWNEVTTPKGVTVQLASPAAGQLGAAGVGARVDYHFWRRFGGSVMISLIGDLSDSYANRQQSGDGQRITFENSSEAAQDMATEALKNSINIPPTGYINHGTLINIMVARDVDFSGVYEVVKPYEIF